MRIGPKSKYLIDSRMLVVLSFVLVFFKASSIHAVPTEQIPLKVNDFLEEAIIDYSSDNVRAFDVHSSGMICIEYEKNEKKLKFKFDRNYRIIESRNSFYNNLEDSFSQSPEENINISKLPNVISNNLRMLFPEIELFTFSKVESTNETFYLVDAAHQDVSVQPIFNGSGELTQFTLDRDNDGLSDSFEMICGLDHQNSDSDQDGFPDGLEHHYMGDALNAKVAPRILKMEHDKESEVVVITINTCKGKMFSIQSNALGGKNNWKVLGEPIIGSGLEHEFNIPDNGNLHNLMFRVGIDDIPQPNLRNGPMPPKKTKKRCNVPIHLKGKEIFVGQGRRLVFRNSRRGEFIEGGEFGNMVTPFSYTFNRTESCKGRLVLTFSNRHGFETTIYNLTFVNKGGSGAYVANKIEGGVKKSSIEGSFTISMNH